MPALVVGLSHRTAPVEVRERVVIPAEELPRALAALRQTPGVQEGFILSTCNRTEFYVELGDPSSDAERLRHLVAETSRIPFAEIEAHLYVHEGEAAVRHAFRVSSSLDSMVVGESQILGQVKGALAAAQSAGAAGRLIGRLMERAFAVSKRVRSETAVGENPSSVGSVAVDLARTIFGDLAGRSVLLVGAGKMGRLTLRHLRAAGVGSVLVANRTAERAEEMLRQLGGGFHVPLEQLAGALEGVDIALSSIAMGRFVLDRAGAEELRRRRRSRPLLLVDIAVPRSIDPGVNEVESLFLYDIDDLQGVIAENLARRGAEAARAELLVAAETEAYCRTLRELDVVPAIRELIERFESTRQAELERHLGRLELTPQVREAVDQATRALVNKIAHGAIQELKRVGASPEGSSALDSLRRALLGGGRGGGTR